MKSILSNSLFFILIISLSSCFFKSEDRIDFHGEVEMSFMIKDDPNSSGRMSSTPSKVIISIKDAADNMVYTLEEITLVHFNGAYISSPISLETGNYTLTEFLVTDASDNTLYACPQEGSPLAYNIADPLPISFTISSESTSKLTPEVLSSSTATPADFGYTNFAFDEVETFDILLSAFVLDTASASHTLTSADVIIYGDNTSIYDQTVSASTNQITLKDGYTLYDVVVSKSGYTTDSTQYTHTQMQAFFTDPLIVSLTVQ